MSQPTDVTNYDGKVLSIASNDIFWTGQAINTLISDVVTQLTTVMDAFNNLQLSWTGGSASLAQDFSDRWTSAMTALFGTDGDPASGVLMALSAGLGSASNNYNLAEETIWGMFYSFNVGLTSPPASANPGQNSVTDTYGEIGQPANVHSTSVNETDMQHSD